MNITQPSNGSRSCRVSESKENRSVRLSPSERRLLLTSTLCLLLKRSRHNFPVTADDLLKLVPYTDPATASEPERAVAA